MATSRLELEALLEQHYRSAGWKVGRADDGTVRATGLGGVTWIGLPIVPEDLDESFEARLLALSAEHMPHGQLCPLELLPATECAERVRGLVDRLRLRDRGNLEVYSLAV